MLKPTNPDVSPGVDAAEGAVTESCALNDFHFVRGKGHGDQGILCAMPWAQS